MPKKPDISQLQARAVNAEAMGSRWLADANEASERGNRALAEKRYDKAQYWLDRANALRDQIWLAKHETS